MNEDLNGDEAMQRFEDLGRKLFQVDKPYVEEITESEPDPTEPDEGE